MKYLTVGTNEIRDDLFRNIENTESIKPRGGLWLTQYDERIKDYNHWVDFILMHPMQETADALNDILKFYEKNNLKTVTVSENLQKEG